MNSYNVLLIYAIFTAVAALAVANSLELHQIILELSAQCSAQKGILFVLRFYYFGCPYFLRRRTQQHGYIESATAREPT